MLKLILLYVLYIVITEFPQNTRAECTQYYLLLEFEHSSTDMKISPMNSTDAVSSANPLYADPNKYPILQSDPNCVLTINHQYSNTSCEPRIVPGLTTTPPSKNDSTTESSTYLENTTSYANAATPPTSVTPTEDKDKITDITTVAPLKINEDTVAGEDIQKIVIAAATIGGVVLAAGGGALVYLTVTKIIAALQSGTHHFPDPPGTSLLADTRV